MNRPTWATVVGVLWIPFGAFGILGGGQEMVMPKLMKMQGELMEEVMGQVEREIAR